MGLDRDEGWSIPADHPFYPPLPAYYRNVRAHYVFFRTDPAAVGRLLPEPLEPAADGMCVACGLAVPFSSNYGSFQEGFVQQKCSFRGQVGWYCSHVFHDGPSGIAAGREIYGTPKIYAGLEVEHVERTMRTLARMAGLPAMTVASTMLTPCRPDAMPSLAPSWRLKIIPHADRPGSAIKQLIDGATAAGDVQVHVSFKGTGTVHFEPNPLCDLTALEPREYLEAFYLETSFREGYAKIDYDYLAEKESDRHP